MFRSEFVVEKQILKKKNQPTNQTLFIEHTQVTENYSKCCHPDAKKKTTT